MRGRGQRGRDWAPRGHGVARVPASWAARGRAWPNVRAGDLTKQESTGGMQPSSSFLGTLGRDGRLHTAIDPHGRFSNDVAAPPFERTGPHTAYGERRDGQGGSQGRTTRLKEEYSSAGMVSNFNSSGRDRRSYQKGSTSRETRDVAPLARSRWSDTNCWNSLLSYPALHIAFQSDPTSLPPISYRICLTPCRCATRAPSTLLPACRAHPAPTRAATRSTAST